MHHMLTRTIRHRETTHALIRYWTWDYPAASGTHRAWTSDITYSCNAGSSLSREPAVFDVRGPASCKHHPSHGEPCSIAVFSNRTLCLRANMDFVYANEWTCTGWMDAVSSPSCIPAGCPPHGDFQTTNSCRVWDSMLRGILVSKVWDDRCLLDTYPPAELL